MPSTEARIRTDRASRYLAQLCGHTAQISVHPPRNGHGTGVAMAAPRGADRSETDGVIYFDRGRCTLRASGEELVLLVEAENHQDLQLMRDAITTRLGRIGRRDRLGITWRPGSAQPDQRD